MHLFVVFLLVSAVDLLSAAVEERCLQPITDDKTCRARIPTIYYNSAKGSCDCYYYSGCRGSENRFKALSECMYYCSVSPAVQTDLTPCETLRKRSILSDSLQPTPAANIPSPRPVAKPLVTEPPVAKPLVTKPPVAATPKIHVCDQPLVQGTCRAYIPSFYYNKKSRKCDCFIYSGCKGNDNRFKSMYSCMSKCGVKSSDQIISDSCIKDFDGTKILVDLLNDPDLKGNVKSNTIPICEQIQKEGTCRAYLPSFYFDSSSGVCDCFIYSGCNGNENRFRSMDACTKTCGVPLNNQGVSIKCQKSFEGTQILVDMLNDPRLKGNTPLAHRDGNVPHHGPGISFFPVLPVLPRPPSSFNSRLRPMNIFHKVKKPIYDSSPMNFFESKK